MLSNSWVVLIQVRGEAKCVNKKRYWFFTTTMEIFVMQCAKAEMLLMIW
jgi:hypothetical protein